MALQRLSTRALSYSGVSYCGGGSCGGGGDGGDGGDGATRDLPENKVVLLATTTTSPTR